MLRYATPSMTESEAPNYYNASEYFERIQLSKDQSNEVTADDPPVYH